MKKKNEDQKSLFPEKPKPPKKSRIEDPRFDITASHHGGNTESVEANLKIAATKAESRARVYKFAIECGIYGLTADHTAIHFNCTHNHVAPRISELKALKMLLPTNQRRLTRSGSPARVLIADKCLEQFLRVKGNALK